MAGMAHLWRRLARKPDNKKGGAEAPPFLIPMVADEGALAVGPQAQSKESCGWEAGQIAGVPEQRDSAVGPQAQSIKDVM